MTTSTHPTRCKCVKPRLDLSMTLCVECGFKVPPPVKVETPVSIDKVDMEKAPVVRDRSTERPTKELTPIRSAERRGGVANAADLLVSIVPPDTLDPDTPSRFVKALDEFTSGYGADLGTILKCFPLEEAKDAGIVAVRGIPFASLCEHHVLPFTGTVAVVYLPNDRIVGLSKIPRLVRAVTRRLQVQERIGTTIADALVEHVGALGAMVIIRGRHTCMALRGIESPGEMVTSVVRGVFRTDATARAEAMALIKD